MSPRAVAVVRVALVVHPRPRRHAAPAASPLACRTSLILLVDGAAIERWFGEGQETTGLMSALRVAVAKTVASPRAMEGIG
jgi:hypothetical protein